MENPVSKDASLRDHKRPAIEETPFDPKNVPSNFRDQKTSGIPRVPRLLKLSVDMLRRSDPAASPRQEAADLILHAKRSHCARCRRAGFVNSEDPRDIAISALIATIDHDPNMELKDLYVLSNAIKICDQSKMTDDIKKELDQELKSITLKKSKGNDPAVHDVGEF